ncbi:uncharacterized protein CCOS01_08341 [Colletotrichum costaricense]|uniref:LysM domain-containing protein n=1 Tax=Colletotrichum costaricense TaxID=1209916 RepID=A0AAJ0DZJ4_9PEZI|nr:uncharacterized protein CCOS01_08341 [Colletotrichum costaricense]KAK1525923.1 hypothetical protein CCOS01_08341 [Colletotrichum costaricense]
MRSTLVSFAIASLATAAAARTSRRHPAHVRRQTGPVAPGTASDCTYYDTAVDRSYNCDFFQIEWGLSAPDFLDYNPSVGADCSGIVVGNSYWVEVNYGLPRPTTRVTATLPATTTAAVPVTTTGPSKPSPTQEGLAEDCTAFYFAVSGDTCDKIVSAYGSTFTFADFYKWNPAGIVNKYGTFDLNQFYGWNPAVGNTCSGLWLGYYYCIAVTDTLTTTSTTAAPAPPAETCNPSAPTPTQPSAICGCKKWHLIDSDNTCDAITKQYGVTLSDFTSWNPSVGSTCTSLWLGYYVCVAK